MTKHCNKCDRDFPFTHEHFPRSRGKLVGPCKECRRARSKQFHRANPLNRVGHQLKRKFNITIEQYDEIYNAQHGRCWICSKHQSQMKKRLAVDHCHATGLIRKLLCQNCNQGFGHFKENPAVLRRAAEYAEMFESVDEQRTQLYIDRRP